jgi:hypothetical protein
VRARLVACIGAFDTGRLQDALEPIRALREEPPAAIERDVSEARVCFESVALIIEQLASRAGPDLPRGTLAEVADRVAQDDPTGDLDAAVVLVALARHEPVPAVASKLGSKTAAPLAAALRLAKPKAGPLEFKAPRD